MPEPGRRAQRAAIVLSGGRGSRLGGVSKALMRIDGCPALSRVVDALLDAGREVVVIVGPETETRLAMGDGATDPRLRTATETDRFGGPVVAIAAGAAELRAAGVAGEAHIDLVPCDLVHPVELVAALDVAISSAARAGLGGDGIMLVDEEGREQWLATCIRFAALEAALDGATVGEALRRRLGGLDLARVEVAGRVTRDIDTPSDLAAYGANIGPTGADTDDTTMEET